MIHEILATIHAQTTLRLEFVYLALATFVAIFVFWRSVRRTMTRESAKDQVPLIDQSSLWGFRVFDLLLISGLISVVVSRLSYLLAQPELLENIRWFWLPYERIEGTVYWFSSLPWLVFKVWEGRVLLDGLVLGWLVSLVVVSRLMKVKWGSISNALADFFWVWFIAVELYSAVIWEIPWLLLIVAVLLALGFVRYRAIKTKREKGSSTTHRLVSVIWKVSTIVGIPIAMLINNVYVQDVVYEQFAVALNIVAAVVGLWVISGDVLEFFAIISGDKEDEMVIATEDRGAAEVGRAYSGGEGGWRRFTHGREGSIAVRHGARGKGHHESRRSYDRSYKDFTKRWRSVVVAFFTRLTKRRTNGRSEGSIEKAG